MKIVKTTNHKEGHSTYSINSSANDVQFPNGTRGISVEVLVELSIEEYTSRKNFVVQKTVKAKAPNKSTLKENEITDCVYYIDDNKNSKTTQFAIGRDSSDVNNIYLCHSNIRKLVVIF